MSEWDKIIKDANKSAREANMYAMKKTGWKRKIDLLFARFFSWVSDECEEAKRDEQRGKDDNYHDEY